ncbi:MAG: DNA translocase FtsK [Anaerolineales bacterium]|jgi:S-DNA-T family DNA segregation ATPase FtsK/SpoIIIE
MPLPTLHKPGSAPPRDRPDQTRFAGWVDRLARLETHFGRFLWDILGILLLAFALMTLLGILGLSKGSLLEVWVNLLYLWIGWGDLLIVLFAGAGGVLAFCRSVQPIKVRWDRVIAMELVAFLSLALLSVVNGNKLTEGAMWGGQIGWGLAMLITRYIGPIWGGLIVFTLWGLMVLTAFGLWHPLEAWLLKQAGTAGGSELGSTMKDASENATSENLVISPLSSDKSIPSLDGKNTGKKTAQKLPPEFRKSFKVSERQDSRPAAPQPRSERLPPLNVLLGEQSIRPDERNINQTAGLIEKSLSEFGIPAKVVGFHIGPTVTQFAVQPGFIRKGTEEDSQQMKVRVAQIANLQKDLALALSAERLRIEAPVPGRAYVGIEVPNSRSALVRLRPLLETDAFYKVGSPLAIALGRDVSGGALVADLARMPHLLIAGTTGSGKSVCIAALATCLAMNNAPEDLRMVMIDSKMVELIRFNGLPHLFGKVETDITRILGVLRWVVVEMEHRYKLLEAAKARDIDAYNRRLQRRKETSTLPRIVVLIDEMADLMMSAPDQTEHNLVRLAQMARATGIHLVVATQRPSTDVVTGLIKANFPARLAFAVASGVDSRVILDLPGAETLLGRGDMLFLNPEVGNPIRAQGVMVSDQEIERVIAHWQKMVPEKDVQPPWEAILSEAEVEGSDDVLVEQAITILKREQRASASMLQRRLRIGYPRAARLLDQLEEMGVVGPSMGGGRDREVLLESEEDNEDLPEDA